jgi:sulfatase maturation enzyme AslB (radical SAM superfamily)
MKKYRNFIHISISIDGNKELHDKCRLDLQGNGTYDRAIKASRHIRENYDRKVTTKMTLSPENINYLYDAVISLIKEGYIIIHLNCIFEKGWEYSHAKILYN